MIFRFLYDRMKFFSLLVEGMMIACALLAVLHKVLGIIVTTYIQNTLTTKQGAFDINIEWISLRLGFDRNEIVVHGFSFKNPPNFDQSHDFIRIEELRVIFDIHSILRVFYHCNSNVLRINLIEIDRLTIHAEKGKRSSHGINVFAALGASTEAEEKGVKRYIANELASVTTDSKLRLLCKAFDSDSGTLPISQEEFNDLPATSESKGDDHESDETLGSWQDIPSDDDFGPEDSSIPASTKMATSHDTTPPKEQPIAKPKDIASPGSNPKDKEAKEKAPEYRYEVDRFLAHDIKIYAQDFLAAKHVDSKLASHIDLSFIRMGRGELTARSNNRDDKRRRAVKLNDLQWRIISRIISEVFKTNSFSLATMLVTATADQTINTVLDVANVTKQGVSNLVYNFNPLEAARASSRREAQKTIAKQAIYRSPSITNLDVNTLRVRVMKVRDIKNAGGGSPSTMKCLLRMKYRKSMNPLFPTNDENGNEFNTGLIETKTATKNRENEATFNQEVFLEPLFSLDAIFHIRVFESGFLGGNTFACELLLPIRECLHTGENSKECVGIKTEVVTTHYLYDKGKSYPVSGKSLGQIDLGLSIISK